MFVHHNVAGLRLELVEDIRVPSVANQNPTFSTVRCMNGLPDAAREVPHPVRRIGSAHVRETRKKSHFEIDNFDACLASGCQYFRYRVDSLSNAGNIKSSQVHHAALGAKIILHVNDDYRSLCSIDREGVGLGIEAYKPALRVLNGR